MLRRDKKLARTSR